MPNSCGYQSYAQCQPELYADILNAIIMGQGNFDDIVARAAFDAGDKAATEARRQACLTLLCRADHIYVEENKGKKAGIKSFTVKIFINPNKT